MTSAAIRPNPGPSAGPAAASSAALRAAITPEIERRVAACVTPETVQAFARDGAVCLRGLLSPDEVALLHAGIDANVAAPSERAKIASRPDDPGRFFEDFCNWQRLGEFQRFVQQSPAALAAQRLMQSPSVRLYHDHVLVKEPGTRQRTPWHQDQPYYNIEGRQNISMWIAVDPVPRAVNAGVRRRLAPGAMADAAQLHGPPGQVVPRGQPGRPARHRSRPRCRIPSWAGGSSPATWCASTC